ncbi:MAG: SurA N-terminal domain-containing protein [Terracidiphilus sp.]
MQASSSFRVRCFLAAIVLFGGALFSSLAGCHRPPSADVVATVNGKEILRAELERNYQSSLGDNPQKPSPQEAEIRRLSVLHQMIQDEVLLQRAAKLNLTASDEDVNARLTEIKTPYTQDQFYNLLKQRNLTLDDFKRDIRLQLTETKLINKEIESKINITDAQIAAFYAAHKADFNLIEPQYHLAWIVASGGPAERAGNMQSSSSSGDADAKKKIQAIYGRLESGQDFSAVATQFSDDPNTASNGGDMGILRESQLRSDPVVYDAISKLKPDQFTDFLPVYDSSGPGHKVAGYAIYKLISRQPAGQRELNDPRVQQAIHQSLHDSQKQLLQTAYLETLMDDARVRNYLAEQILKQGAQ